MLLEKKRFSVEDLDAQTALELPDREMMLVTVVITNLLNNATIDVDVHNNNVAVQVCAAVQLINAILVGQQLSCFIGQR